MKAEKLASDCLLDVMSFITEANFELAVKYIAASAYTSDDLIDLRNTANSVHWPQEGRGLILDSTVVTALMKYDSYKLTVNVGGSEVIREGKLPRLSEFDIAEMPSFPANGELLIGVMVHMSGLLSAFSPVDPTPEVRNALSAYEVAADPDTGISMNYRRWGNPDSDRSREILEVSYGYAPGEPAAIKRLVKPE